MLNFALTATGYIVIGAACFVVGVVFSDVAKAPVLTILGWLKSAYNWIKAKF